MERPPNILNDSRVLEFAVLDDTVQRTSEILLDAGPGEPKPVEALAICQALTDELDGVLYLFFCTSDWCVDRIQMWNWPGGGPEADSTQVIKDHAGTLWSGLDNKWVKFESE